MHQPQCKSITFTPRNQSEQLTKEKLENKGSSAKNKVPKSVDNIKGHEKIGQEGKI